jgi:ABC-type transport system involved in multi-copper enzyme maturation permease subunit
MSVNKHTYQAYTGRITPLWMRIYVLARYGVAEAWSSKITVALFVLSILPFLVFLVGIYLANNPIARAIILKSSNGAVDINANYFLTILESQCWIALVLTSWISPRLISFDLADNALPILLSHPISRPGYVLGKFLALFACLSMVTWVPCMLLFIYQGYSAPQPWFMAHLSMAVGLLCGTFIWIILLALLSLALSAWVKWRVVATGVIFAAVFVPAGVGAIVSAILRTRWGFLLNLPAMMTVLWSRLIGAPEFMRPERTIPTPAIVMMLIVVCLVCFAMLNARIRAREVVRG